MNSISRRCALACILSVFVTTMAHADLIAFSDFGPGNTYGNFGDSIGGQFVNGFQFTSAASGSVSEFDIGIGGSGTFTLTMYTDNSGQLGSSIWTGSSGVGAGSPNPAVINVVSGPSITTGGKYWLVGSGPSNTAFWSPNTIGVMGPSYHHDNGTTQYFDGTLGAFAVHVVPEPATFSSLLVGMIGIGFICYRKRRKVV